MHTIGALIEDNRLLVRFRNYFGKLLQKTLLFYNEQEHRVEFRHEDEVVPVGKVEEINGVRFIIIPIPPEAVRELPDN